MSVRKIDRLEPDQLIVCHCSANNSKHPEIVEFSCLTIKKNLFSLSIKIGLKRADVKINY